MYIGHKVRELREKKGLSQSELGERIKKSQARISDIENNKTIPDWLEIQGIAKELDVPISEFQNLNNVNQFNHDNENNGSGYLFVNTLNYYGTAEQNTIEIPLLKEKLSYAEDKIRFLESQLTLLQNLLEQK
jgi:transcriptional regulator with XRE-family HTH domain